MTSREAYIALNLVPGIGPVTVRQLLREFGTPEEILRQPRSRLGELPGLGERLAEQLAAWPEHADVDGELRLAERGGVQLLTLDDPDYPAPLRELPDSPLVLYVRGDLEALRLAKDAGLAIVGSRRATNYGMQCAGLLAAAAAQAGWVVVSGLAVGIDTAAHDAVLKCQGRTIAVLACGLAEVYPPENVDLARRLCAQGALVSEHPMLRRPDRRYFPMRNRIISGLALGTLVVEAGTQSGALITARMALEQGRSVFAVPGRIDSPMARGCHQLIKQGAKLVESLDDIVEEFGFLPGFRKATAPELPADPDARLGLSEVETRLWQYLREHGECTLDDLAIALDLPIGDAIAALFALELKRAVRQLPGRRFELARNEKQA